MGRRRWRSGPGLACQLCSSLGSVAHVLSKYNDSSVDPVVLGHGINNYLKITLSAHSGAI